MRISYRVLRLGILLELAGAGRVMGQSALSPGREDSLKGVIWTKTAQRIWADVKPKQPQPAAWATGTSFGNWALTTPADPSELGLLRRDVIGRLGKGQPSHPAEVADAIIAVVQEKHQSKTGALARVNLAALQADLVAFLPVAAAAAPIDTPATRLPKVAPTRLPATYRDTIPEAVSPPLGSSMAILPPTYFGLSAGQAGTTLALLGLLLGAGGMYWFGPKRRRSHGHLGRQSSRSSTHSSHANTTMTEEEEARLRQQIKQLEKRVSELETLLPQPRREATAPPPPARVTLPAAEPPPVAEELSIEELVGAPPVPAPALPPATRYGPVQETPFVEERKIVDSPLPQLALMLMVNPQNPDQAVFTLNPQVDQARLIGDGLTRLQKFFDYDLPAAGRITAVAAGAKGTLQRHADGWQVVERARLLIS